MKKLLIAPSKMTLPDIENQIYQNLLKLAAEISLNLMAVKVENHPDQFLPWCREMLDIAKNRINFELLDKKQLPTVKKLQEQLISAISYMQIKMLRIAPWPVVADFILQQKDLLALDERIRLLDYLGKLRATPLANMIPEDRQAFTGRHSPALEPGAYPFDVQWFASTKNAKGFHILVSDHPEALDKALAHIALEGEVSKADYMAFVNDYCQAFELLENEAPTLSPATRLLAMRRPDIFPPITNSRADALCMGFGITRLGNRDFENYWNDLVDTLHTRPWFAQASSEQPEEQRLSEIKALLPTLFYYADADTAANSNYLKLLHKPKRAATGTKSVRRGRESAQILVDRALAAEEIPQHIRDKRDSIIQEVEKGRSVDDTISLMRVIFG